MAKHLVCVELNGGMDGINFFGPTDQESATLLTNARQGAPGNVPNFTPPLVKTCDLVRGSNIVTNIDTTGIVVGRKVYGEGLTSKRQVTVAAIGTNQITLSDVSYETLSGATLYVNPDSNNLYYLDATGTHPRAPAMHYTQSLLADLVTTPDTPENADKAKGAIIASIGPLRKKLYKDVNDGNRTKVVGTNLTPKNGIDIPAFLTSHNDQTSTFQSNAPEGSVKGWGGGIVDFFMDSTSQKNKPLLTVSAGGLPVFSAGDNARTFTFNQTDLINNIPNIRGTYTGDSNPAVASELKRLFLEATTIDNGHLISQSGIMATNLAKNYQDVLRDVSEITTVTGEMLFTEPGGNTINGNNFAQRLRQIVKMIFINNPNRGATGSRTGNVLTISTEVSEGLASREAGSTTVRIVSADHGLLTSNTSSSDLTDSVLIDGAGLHGSAPSDGYKVEVDPMDPDNAFFITTTGTTTLLEDALVTFRIKHNVTTSDTIYLEGLESIDTPVNPDGYAVTEVLNDYTFTIETTSTEPVGTDKFYFKPINLDAQVIYTNTAYGWDTHPQPNHSQLAAMNAALTWFESVISRIKRADVVTFAITEFGRTFSTNSQGTDHGWSNNLFLFGKSVKPGIYGDIMDYRPDGPHRTKTYLMPTTSVYQYGATLAKWIGLTDAQILELFPDLVNWDQSERYLGFL